MKPIRKILGTKAKKRHKKMDQQLTITPQNNKPFYIGIFAAAIFLAAAVFLFYLNWNNQKQAVTSPASIPLSQTATSSAQTGALAAPLPKVKTEIIIESTASGQIKGALNIENTSEEALAESYYDLHLRTPEILKAVTRDGQQTADLSEGMLLSYTTSPKFSLKAKEKKSFNFTFPYSANLPPSKYKLSTFVLTGDAQNLGGATQSLALSGKNQYLWVDPSSCKLLVEGKEFAPNIGPNVSPGQSPQGVCQVTNRLSKTIKVYSVTDYAIRYVLSYPPSEKYHSSTKELISFAPGESKPMTFTLPSLTTPQVWEAFVWLIDEQNEQASVGVPFRWIIRGPSAFIQSISLDKDYYTKGEAAQIDTLISPSMDLFWRTASAPGQDPNEGTDLLNAQLLAAIYTDKGELCGQAEKPLASTKAGSVWEAEKVEVKITRSCPNPKAEIKISEGEKVLATLSRQTMTSDAVQKSTAFKWQFNTRTIIGIGLAILAIVIFITLIFIYRKYQNLIIFLGAGLSLGTFLLLHQLAQNTKVFAACENSAICSVLNPAGPLWIKWVRSDGNPVLGYFWLDGSQVEQISDDTLRVTFLGRTEGLNCGNIFTGFKLENFIDNSAGGISVSIESYSLGDNPNFWNTGGVNQVNSSTIFIHHPVGPDNDTGVNGPLSVTYTLRKEGGFANNYRLKIDQDFYYTAGGENHFSSDPDNAILARPLADGRTRCGGNVKGCLGRVEFLAVGGRVTNQQSGAGIGGVQLQAFNSDTGQTKTATTNSQGYWNAFAFTKLGTSYAVRVSGNSASPQTAPSGYSPPAKTTAVGWNWNNCANGDTAQGSGSYECQRAGSADCSGANNQGTLLRCSFAYDSAYDSLTANPLPPAIDSLRITNRGSASGGTVQKTSGNQAGTQQGGSGWFNPIEITLNATQGSNPIGNYYVAFYDRASIPLLSNSNTFLADIRAKINSNPKNGFLLRYEVGPPAKHYVWDYTISSIEKWKDISNETLTGWPICGSGGCTTQTYYVVFPIAARTWKISLYTPFESKNVYTAGYVEDNSPSKLAGFQADIAPTPIP